jgi:hypothetical protein
MTDKFQGLCDNVGHIRHNIGEAEILSLSEARRKVLFEVLETHEKELAAEADDNKIDMEIRACVEARYAAQEKLGELRKTTHVNELHRTIKAKHRALGIEISTVPDVEPQDQQAIDRAELAVAEAELARIEACAEREKSKARLKLAREKVAAALAKWQKVSPAPTFEEARAAVMKAQQQRPARKERIHMSALDREMSGGNRDFNVGTGRKHARRTLPAIVR